MSGTDEKQKKKGTVKNEFFYSPNCHGIGKNVRNERTDPEGALAVRREVRFVYSKKARFLFVEA